ncbi:MAG TPA: S8 family serine peptidase [Rhodanobacteraceae bacterium]|jgi:subtilisin family serine protease|nr:S8 family serine peptidase [Rhodanobacteraceae bacterium]
MRNTRITTLVAAIAIALVEAGAEAAAAVSLSTAPARIASASSGAQTYLIRFEEPGVLHYSGGISGIPATAIQSTRTRKLDTRSTAARAYQAYLAQQRSLHLAAISQALGRTLSATHSYAITMNGAALTLTPDEASRVARLPGVASVRASRVFALETYRGPEFIGADSVWNGSAVPGGIGNRGEGVVVGDIDSGINSVHPSFADDATCGFGSTGHKLLSAADCSTTDTNGLCNGPDPEVDPGNGHGVHTASTAVGNTLDASADPPPTIPPPHTFMSGVAPCAHLRTYKVCTLDAGCTDAAITAGIENAIIDSVDVANFSIGPNCGSLPGDSPWSDGDEIWLEALGADVFVAAAAGNTRPGCNDPGGRVSNISPWVATIAASTHDENVSGNGSMSATGPGVPPANTVGTLMLPGSGLDTGQPFSGVPIRYYADNPIGCTVNGGFPPGYFNGAVALLERGNCTYEEKIDNAQASGALLAVVYNNQDGYVYMGVGGATLPAYSILQADGLAYVGFIDASSPTSVTVDFVPATRQGDVLAGFSLRGPDVLTTITKPDLTAPGINIYAALDSAENNYGYFTGTSMSTPHISGAAALLRSIRPEWSPSEVKSALMLTADTNGTREDLTTPWTADDVGGGRADLSKAALAGFVLDETYSNYFAADPAHGGDPKTLNIAAMRNVDGCDAPSPCTWTRTLRDALPGPSSWTVSVNAPAGFDVAVDPPSFAFGGTGAAADTVFRSGFDTSDTATVAVTATTDPSLSGAQFAELVFHEANGAAPDAHMYVAVKGTSGGQGFGVVCFQGTCTLQVDSLTTNFVGVGCPTYCGLVWLNRFTPDPQDFPITITSISTIFGSDPGWNAIGDHINFYVYQDSDTDPSNGAVLAGSYQGYTMPAPVDAFTTITLPVPIVVNGPGDVVIALTNPAPNVGSRPASADAGPFAARSWIALSADIGAAPDLSAIGLLPNPAALGGFDGNWLIRATGTNAGGQPIVLGLPDKK